MATIPVFSRALWAMTLALSAGPWNISHAELSFNWTPRADIRDATQGLPFAICNVAGQANQGNCGTNFFFSSPDTTPFVQEIVKDVNGAKYYHLVVGDPSQGFAQEIYIGRGTSTFADGSRTSASLGWAASGLCFGGSPFPGAPPTLPADDKRGCGNGYSPLSSDADFSGNGSGNPNRVIMRQVVSDGQMTQEFLKASFTQKPKITQTVADPQSGLQIHFVADMSNSTYSDNTTPALITNTLTFTPPALATDGMGPANFDMATGAQSSSVSGGRYIYNDGTAVGFGGAGGTYGYVNGGDFNLNVEWSSFRDPGQNP